MRLAYLAAGLLVPALAGTSFAADPAAPAVCSLDDLVRMDRCQLESLYRQAGGVCAPHGVTSGRAIYNPGSRLTVPMSRAARLLWQGKDFKDDGLMLNRVCGLRVSPAKVYVAESWLDGRPSVIMDYRGMPGLLFRGARDEMREVAPGIYLGLMYKPRDTGPELAMFFALDARR